ncbi:preprotein translocase subunit SecE [Thermodesulfobacteriota bacterium]
MIAKALQFLREFRVEMKKVTWPSRKDTIAGTSVVIIITLIISFYLGTVDILLTKVMNFLLS